MKPQQFSSLGIDINLTVPESPEEFNKNAAGHPAANPCLAEAINNVVYRGCLADFRNNMLEAVEKITGIKRETEPVLDDKGQPKMKESTIIEVVDGVKTEKKIQEPVLKFKGTEGKYFGKVCAQLGVENEVFQPLAQLVIDGLKITEGDNLVIPDDRRERLEAIITSFNGDPDVFDEVAATIGIGIVFDASATPKVPSGPKETAKIYLIAADKLISDGHGSAVAAKLSEILGQTFTADRESLGKAIQLHEAKKRAEAQKKLADSYAGLIS